MKHGMSRTTAWRRRKSGVDEDAPRDGRGRHTNAERAERLAFVGAVVAQLIEGGTATHHGLKTCATRLPTERERELKAEISRFATIGEMSAVQQKTAARLLAELGDESQNATISGDVAISWKRPSDSVWGDVRACPHNPDCVALVVVYSMSKLGCLSYSVRPKSLRGTFHSDSTPKRNRFALDESGAPAPMKTPWRVIDGMTRQTASYWKLPNQKTSFNASGRWFFDLLKKHGAMNISPSSATGILRDDIKDFLAGKPVKAPKTELRAPALQKRRGNGFTGAS